MSLTIPNTFAEGQKILASGHNENNQTIASKFSSGPSGISNSDISDAAAIDGTKLSTVNPIPTDRIADDAITQVKLKDDATAGSPTAAVTTNHIVDGAVSAAKIGTAAVIASKLKVTTFTQVLALVVPANVSATVWQEIVFLVTPAGIPAIDTIAPLACYLKGAAAAPPNAQSQQIYQPQLQTDSAGTVYFIIRVAQPQSSAGFTVSHTLCFKYVAAS